MADVIALPPTVSLPYERRFGLRFEPGSDHDFDFNRQDNVVVCVDQSLNCSGIAVIGNSKLYTGKIVPGELKVGKKGQLLSSVELLKGTQRLNYAADALRNLLSSLPSNTRVIMEGLSMRSRSGQLDQIAALQWYLIDVCTSLGLKVWVIPPRTAKKVTTGSGNADKDRVVAAAVEYHGFDVSASIANFPFPNYKADDEADALLMGMALKTLGCAPEMKLETRK